MFLTKVSPLVIHSLVSLLNQQYFFTQVMNWKIIYHIYEGIAILLIAITWKVFVFNPVEHHQEQLNQVQQILEVRLKKMQTKTEITLEKLRKEIDRHPDSKDEIIQLQFARSLDSRTNRVVTHLEQIKQLLDKQGITAQKVEQLVNAEITWLQTELKDWNLDTYSMYAPPPTLLEGTSSSQASITTHQYQLQFHKFQVLEFIQNSNFTFRDCFGASPYAVPVSNYVQVGDEFIADIIPFDSCDPLLWTHFYFNGKEMRDQGGSAKVEFPIKALGTKSWEAKLEYRNQEGKIKTITQNIPYTTVSYEQAIKLFSFLHR